MSIKRAGWSTFTREWRYSQREVIRKETIIDNFQLWVEDDILCMRPSGPMTLAIADWISAAALDILSRHEGYYILGDLGAAGAIPPMIRRRLAEFGAAHPPRAIALFHVGLVSQGINALLFGALNLLAQRKLPWRQCEDEASARQWLRAHRPAAAQP